MMEIARGEPIADNGLGWAKGVIGSPPRRSDLLCHRLRGLGAVRGWNDGQGSREASGWLELEVTLLGDDGPGDAGELVGQRDGGDVVASALLEGQRPGDEAVRPSALGAGQHRSGPVDEEHAQVGVAAFADASQAAGEAAGAFAGGDAEVAGEVAARREAMQVADEGEQRRGGQPSDAGHGAEPAHRGDLSGQEIELALHGLDALLEVADLQGGFGQGEAQGIGDARLGSIDPLEDPGHDVVGTLGDGVGGMVWPSSRRMPRTVWMRAVLSASQAERSRCRAATVWRSTDLTGTGRISSLRYASSIPLASARPVFERPTYGRTLWGGSSTGVWPSCWSSRAQ